MHQDQISLVETSASVPLLSNLEEEDKGANPNLFDDQEQDLTNSTDLGSSNEHWKDIDLGQFRFAHRICMKRFLRYYSNFTSLDRTQERDRESSPQDPQQIWINYNVLVILGAGVVFGAMTSVWTQTVTGAYLTQKTESDDLMNDDEDDAAANAGYIVSATSILITILSLPLGFYLDGIEDPIRFMKLYAKFMVLLSITCAIYLASLDVASADDNFEVTDESTNYTFFAYLATNINFVSIGLLYGGPCFTIYIHSLPKGNTRWKGFTRFYASLFMFQFIGPLLNIMLYENQGSAWSLSSMRKVMYFGLILIIFTSTFILRLDNNKLIRPVGKLDQKKDMDALSEQSDHPETIQFDSDNIACTYCESSYIYRFYYKFIGWIPGRKDIGPLILLGTSLIGFGTGLTEGYFRRYFNDNTRLDYSEVELVYVALPFFVFAGFFSSTYYAGIVGRVPCILLYKISGSIVMFVMGLLIDAINQYTTNSAIPAYFLKSVLIYGSIPIETSILIDFLEEDQLFIYLSVYYCVSFSWDAAASLGELLDGSVNYGNAIVFASAVQLSGALLYIPMLPAVTSIEAQNF